MREPVYQRQVNLIIVAGLLEAYCREGAAGRESAVPKGLQEACTG